MHKIIDYTLEEGSQTSEESQRDGEYILTSLTYIGKNSENNSGIYLARTFEKAKRNNEKSGVTSALAINDNYFIQNLEGSRPAINEFLARVIDERPHLALQVVCFEEIDERRWDGFLIKYLTSSAQDEEHTLSNFSAGADFNPYLMKRDQITSFIEAIFEEQESQGEDDV